MFHGEQCGSKGGGGGYISDLSAAGGSSLPVIRVRYILVRCTVQQRVFLYDAHVKYGSVQSVRENFYINFVMKEFRIW
jgi:hypothetical protein